MTNSVTDATGTSVLTLPIVRFGSVPNPTWIERQSAATNGVEGTGIESIAFSPRTISVEEASVILGILGSNEVLPIPRVTAVEEDAADFLGSISQ